MEQSSTNDPKIKLKVISKGIWNKRARPRPKKYFKKSGPQILDPISCTKLTDLSTGGLGLYSTVHVSAMQQIFAMLCSTSNG